MVHDMKSELTEGSFFLVSLIEVHSVTILNDNDVPRVDGAGRAHKNTKDVVGREDLSLALSSNLQNKVSVRPYVTLIEDTCFSRTS